MSEWKWWEEDSAPYPTPDEHKTMDLRFIWRNIDAFPKKHMVLQQRVIIASGRDRTEISEEWRDVEIVK